MNGIMQKNMECDTIDKKVIFNEKHIINFID